MPSGLRTGLSQRAWGEPPLCSHVGTSSSMHCSEVVRGRCRSGTPHPAADGIWEWVTPFLSQGLLGMEFPGKVWETHLSFPHKCVALPGYTSAS